MTWMDHALTVGFAVIWPLWALREYPRHRDRVRAGVPGARLASYAEAMIVQWLFAAGAAALWIHLARDWSELGLVGPSTGPAWIGLAVAVALAGVLFAQSATVARRPDTHGQVRTALSPYAEILPIDRSDLRGFVALSVTAGICEELLFRGLLPWYLAHWLGLWGGQATALVIFAAAHLYLGPRATVPAFLAGLLAAGLVLWTGSLLPAMLLHAGADITSGWMAYEVLRQPPRSTDGAVPA